MKTSLLSALLCLLVASAGTQNGRAAEKDEKDDRYLRAVQVFADRVLEHGRDTYDVRTIYPQLRTPREETK